MSNKKVFNIIVGVALAIIGVIFILCAVIVEMTSILLGICCIIGGGAIATRALIANRKILQANVVLGAILVGVAIAMFVETAIGFILIYIINYVFIAIGALLLVDTIYHFVKGRAVVTNIIELVMALVALVLGILAVIPSLNLSTLMLYIIGGLAILAGIVVVIASLVDFNKYIKKK